MGECVGSPLAFLDLRSLVWSAHLMTRGCQHPPVAVDQIAQCTRGSVATWCAAAAHSALPEPRGQPEGHGSKG